MLDKSTEIEKLSKSINNCSVDNLVILLSVLSAIPLYGGLFAGLSQKIGQLSSIEISNKIVEILKQHENTIKQHENIIKMLLTMVELNNPTKSNMIKEIYEITGVKIPDVFDSTFYIVVIINQLSIMELNKYKQWLNMQSTGSVMTLGCGNTIGNHIEDKKYPYGLGYGFILTITKDFYNKE